MPERVTMATMRHEAAVLSAECVTANLRQAFNDAKAHMVTAKADYNKAFHEAYYKAYDALKDKDAKQ
jgi:hypothetical protein